jgi:hypothetical protein
MVIVLQMTQLFTSSTSFVTRSCSDKADDATGIRAEEKLAEGKIMGS